MSTLLTGNGIKLARLLSLKSMLELELNGLKRRGRSTYAVVKENYGLKGSKRSVYDQFCKIVDQESQKLNPIEASFFGTELDPSRS